MLIITLILTGLSLMISLILGSPVIRIFGPDAHFINNAGIISLFFLIAVPIFGWIAFFLKIAFKIKVTREVNFSVWTVWFIALFVTFYSGTMIAVDYKHKEVQKSSSDFTIDSKEIFISSLDEVSAPQNIAPFVEVPVKYKGDSLYFNTVSVTCKKSDSPFVTIEKIVEARAINQLRAAERVKSISAPYRIEGNKIMFSPWMRIPEESKYRAHDVRYIVYVPKDVNVHFDYNISPQKPISIGIVR